MQFSEVVGQEKTKEKLIRSVSLNRVSHAQLITGLPGSGGLPMALAFAQYINCKNKNETDSCGQCDSCNKSQKLIHPDMHFAHPVVSRKSGTPPISTDYIKEWRNALLTNPYLSYHDWLQEMDAENKQGNITVNECRDIIRKMSLKSFLGDYKIVIIWLPEFLREAGNTLLKILEEPSDNTVFLLVSENSDMILNTILSRTQIVALEKLNDDIIREALKEREQIEESEAASIAMIADGNFREALNMAKHGMENNYLEDFISWMRLCFKIDAYELSRMIDKIVGMGREGQKNFLRYVLHIYRESNLKRLGVSEMIRMTEAESQFSENFCKILNEKNVYKLVEAVNDSAYHIERNANSRIVFFNLSLQINQLIRA